MKKQVLLAVLLLGAASAALAQQGTKIQSHRPQTIQELRSRIASLLSKNRIPGAGIAIVTGDAIEYAGGVGYADMESRTPVSVNTVFATGSITKSFVGLAFLKLLEEGKVDLQAPVREVAPELDIQNPWELTDPVRIVHLLEHTSGFNDIHFNDYYLDGDPQIPLKEALKVSTNCRKVRWRPGSMPSYSSGGYAAAGYILEKITGDHFENYIKNAIFKPLGMTASTFLQTPENRPFFAQGYEGKYRPSPFPHVYARPAGALNSSTRDLALFVQFMLNKGKIGEKQWISEALIERMETPTSDWASRAGLKKGYGLGISNTFYKGFKWRGHNGATIGFAGAYAYSRELGRGCVLLTNYYDWDFIPGINELWHELQDFVISDHAPCAPAVPAIPAGTLHPYVGYYELRNSRQQLVAWLDRMLNGTFISLRDGALFQKDFVGKQRRPLIPVTEQTFRSPAEPDASKIFFQTPEGRWVYYDGDNYYEKSAAWKPWSYIIIFLVAWVLMLSTIPYAIVWIPMHLYKRITKKENRCKYLRPRIVPLLAVMALLFGFISVSNQSLLEFGQKSSANMQFFISTLLFATLSLFALFLAIRSFWKPVKPLARAYALLVSLSCVGMTIFFYSWGIIGLRLWVY